LYVNVKQSAVEIDHLGRAAYVSALYLERRVALWNDRFTTPKMHKSGAGVPSRRTCLPSEKPDRVRSANKCSFTCPSVKAV
jgi:hypothetical protein